MPQLRDFLDEPLEPVDFGALERRAISPGQVDRTILEKPEPPKVPRRSFWELNSAAWQEGNTIYSTTVDERFGVSKAIDPDFDLDAKIRSDGLEQYFGQFVQENAFNEDLYEAVKQNILRQRANDETLAAGGALGVALMLPAAIADPTILIPGGAFVRGTKLGFSVAKSGAVTSAAAAAGVAVQEGVLHLTQVDRDGTKTVFAVGGASILGGIIGSVGAKLLTRSELMRVGTEFAEELKATGVADPEAIAGRLIDEAIAAPGGAAPTPSATLKDLEIAGVSARTLAKITAKLKLSPTLQNLMGESVDARKVTQKIADTPQLRSEVGGESVGASVESKKKGWIGKAGVKTYENRLIRKEAARAGDKIPHDEFNELVGKAMRNDDVDAGGNTFITRAAKNWRKFFDDMYAAGVEAGAFPANLTTRTARSYLHRVWDQTQLIDRVADFNAVTYRWLNAITPKTDPAGDWGGLLNREDYIRNIVDQIYGRLTGRALDLGEQTPDWLVPAVRGPLKNRSFDIPDKWIEDFLVSDIEQVAHRYAATAGGEIELISAFGRADMADQIKSIGIEYDNLVKAAGGDKARLRKLNKERAQTLENTRALRDMIRGVWGHKAQTGLGGSMTRATLVFGGMTKLGGVLISSLADVAGLLGRYGPMAVMARLLPSLTTGLRGLKLTGHEVRVIGSGLERLNNTRLMSLMELMEHNVAISRPEKGINWLSQKFFRMTGLPMWNDHMKTLSGSLAQSRIIQHALDWDSLKAVDRGWLTNLGIGQGDARRIQALVADGTIKKDGAGWLANSDEWMDPRFLELEDLTKKFDAEVAAAKTANPLPAITKTKKGKPSVRSVKANKRARALRNRVLAGIEKRREAATRLKVRERRDFVSNFRGALATDVDRTIVTPGIGDRPLAVQMNHWKLILQFKSFMLAANQRLLLSGLQGRKLWLAQHIVLGTAIGMHIEYFKVWERSGKDEANKLFSNLGRWIVAGQDRAGHMSILMEVNNSFEKMGGPGFFTLGSYIAGDEGDMQGQASRFANRNVGDLMAPAVGTLQDIKDVTMALLHNEVKESTVNAMTRLAPFAGLPWWRWWVQHKAKPEITERLD
jgi:hypothetical protein